jgi:hypothetical protein
MLISVMLMAFTTSSFRLFTAEIKVDLPLVVGIQSRSAVNTWQMIQVCQLMEGLPLLAGGGVNLTGLQIVDITRIFS